MSQKEKLLEKARRNPKGLSFKDFETLMTQHGWIHKRQKGSHSTWHSPSKQLLSVQWREDGKAKVAQVKEFLKILDEEND